MKNYEAKKFGAFVAHILNTPSANLSVVSVHRQRIDGTECSFEQFIKWFLANNQKYLLHLVGILELNLSPPSGSGFRPSLSRRDAQEDKFDEADQAVDLWYSHVFDRALMLTKSEPLHNGHRLLERLLARRQGGDTIRLERQKAPVLALMPAEFSLNRLNREMQRSGAPQPTANAVKTLGPLFACVGREQQVVPDGLSLAAAISCAPETMHVLELDEELDLIAFMQEAMNTANRHWLFLRCLGLSPPAFMQVEAWEGKPFDTLTTNQAQMATKWLNLSRALAEAEGLTEPVHRHFEAAWLEAPISKKLTFESFAQTKAGRALISTKVIRKVSYDALSEREFEPENQSHEFASHAETLSCLDALAGSGALDDVTFLILRELTHGKDLHEIHASHAEIRLRFPNVENLYEHSDDLVERILKISTGLEQERFK